MKHSTALRTVLAAVTVASSLAFGPLTAVAATSKGVYVGTTATEIVTSLEQQGYQVRKVETEDGLLEAYALLDGKRFEIFVDPASGKVVEIKNDD